jgi:tryptophanyl-tRNA synthetase
MRAISILGYLRIQSFKRPIFCFTSTISQLVWAIFPTNLTRTRATDVPVGEDQTQHLELSRDLAALFNKSVGAPVFPIPKPIISRHLLPERFISFRALTYTSKDPAKRILSLKDPTQKMSKSAPNPSSRILLTDSFNQIKAKLKTALTDSERSVSFDPVNRPGVSNLLTIYASCHGDGVSRPEDIAVTLQGKSYSEIKNIVASVVDHRLRPIRQEYERIRMDEGYLRSVAEKGTMQATEIAARTMEEVKSRMGLGTLRDRLLLRGKSD